MSIAVFYRSANGQLSRFQVDTNDPAFAIEAVKDHLFCERIKPEGPVLALIEGGEGSAA